MVIYMTILASMITSIRLRLSWGSCGVLVG